MEELEAAFFKTLFYWARAWGFTNSTSMALFPLLIYVHNSFSLFFVILLGYRVFIIVNMR